MPTTVAPYPINDNLENSTMTNSQKFASGAFVFTRARGLQPRDPTDLEPIAAQHSINTDFIPTYAGDRVAIGRAVSQASAGLHREGYLLRPIRRTSSEVVCGIVREQKDENAARLDHDFEATVSWSAEPEPTLVTGDHQIARRVAAAYADLRGKVVADDWSSAITAYLESHDAARVRGDGRVYWVPPQRLPEVKKFGAFLAEVGIDLVLCEIEAESRTVVEQVAAESLDEQLAHLEQEVADFDVKTKPSTLSRRLDVCNQLRSRATLYRDALGLGAEKAEAMLQSLERQVQEMLDIRQNTVVHRDGTTSPAGPASIASEPPPPTDITTLRFAGAAFTAAPSDDPAELRFVSDAESAIATAQVLEQMGIAGKWQQAGTCQVNIKNSGPVGAAVSIRIKNEKNQPIHTAKNALAALGIELLT
jgi:hypothetical protein